MEEADPLLAWLRTRALRLPEAEEGVACAGTALERRTIKASGKAFLFLGAADLMLKLSASLPEASALAAQAPDRVKAGAGGWVTLRLTPAMLPRETLERWLLESFRLVAPKRAVRQLDAAG